MIVWQQKYFVGVILKVKFEVTKGVNRSCELRRTDNTMATRTNNDLQSTTQKTKD